ncbi:PDR/VanB family oxidoreductase [Noviherbaspirillum sp. CPCC 100848]|uniref:PDR/VanB family oxidoreductase n=1 Tax=Noviherbaspirillum album TaxID=3080276 RepID=A0ABU6JK01_9BURK|nr:PDR/VanB family oxidoreductase [Noviherbaspirillum sp. CPCC 100848]MEC4723404.1 PDR/VanB family oxidoreductase [Noviherbaspirillum sp. CPCC 100848]
MENKMALSQGTESMMQLRIASAQFAAEGIKTFEFVHPEGKALPPFTPGSHIKVEVPNGLIRKYSLCNDPNDNSRYMITVKRDDSGQGGSKSIVDEAKEGDLIRVSEPDNAFPLVTNASSYLFIAGGIGITPILSMIRSFGELPPAPWKLLYLTQKPEATAFRDELGSPELKSNVVIHHDFGDPAKTFDLWPALERPKSGAHIYCCGPRGLMEAVRDMSGHWPHSNVHFESFNEGGGVRPDDKPFMVKLARQDKALEVPVGQSILNVVRAAGYDVRASCESGTCGTCRTKLLSGEADHRDMVLMPEEMENQIMVCVSRAKSAEIVIDL